jgi:hypothetical protein
MRNVLGYEKKNKTFGELLVRTKKGSRITSIEKYN